MEEKRNCCIYKCLGLALITFIGAFLGFYFVVHSVVDNCVFKVFQMKKFERMMYDDFKFDSDMRHELHHRHFGPHGVVEMCKIPDAYKIRIDLRFFGDNEKNIRVSTNGNEIVVTGHAVSDNKNGKYFSEITQSYILDKDADFSKMYKKKVHDKYIITIPVKD